ncbi:MAG: hypothetical protein JWO65_1854 [Sphingomonas bacterium]|nr:hypothetical protein [Sphingomonas bacterium]
MSRKLIYTMLATASALLGATTASAKEYVDYTYGKGIWTVNQIEVDPNHVDEYLTGLKQSQVPGFEIMKKHGIIDDYSFSIRNGYTKGQANVVIAVHYINADGLMPNQARDQMLEKEILATMSEDAGKAAISGYEKYRTFIDDSTWIDVTFKK